MALPMRSGCQLRSFVINANRLKFASQDSRTATILSCRCFSTPPPDHDHVSPPGRLKKYVVDKFLRYVNRYESILGKRYPKVYKVYKVFTGGMRDFLADARSYYSTSTALWSGECLSSFSRKELEIYRQMPRDLFKMAPMLLITALPLAPYAVFPIAYLFPRYFLTSHFWTDQQRTDFTLLSHRKRIQHFPAILDYLHNQCRYLDHEKDKSYLKSQLKKIEKPNGLSVEEILELKRFFQTFPYEINRLSIAHSRHLGRSLGMSLRRRSLINEAILLQHIDHAMVKEGLDKLTDTELEKACFWRGLNPVGMKRRERLTYLKHWTDITENIDDDAISLLLHTPVFLAYSQPTNKIFMTLKMKWRRKNKS